MTGRTPGRSVHPAHTQPLHRGPCPRHQEEGETTGSQVLEGQACPRGTLLPIEPALLRRGVERPSPPRRSTSLAAPGPDKSRLTSPSARPGGGTHSHTSVTSATNPPPEPPHKAVANRGAACQSRANQNSSKRPLRQGSQWQGAAQRVGEAISARIRIPSAGQGVVQCSPVARAARWALQGRGQVNPPADWLPRSLQRGIRGRN